MVESDKGVMSAVDEEGRAAHVQSDASEAEEVDLPEMPEMDSFEAELAHRKLQRNCLLDDFCCL